ncbi:MAG: GMC family oxidoreductase [Rhodothermus sp.]|nr:GMC family oxidoreductase [Rhodothermus sp.]
MKIDLRAFEPQELGPYDLCIVGGGVAGLTLAWALRDSGLGICLLETGGEQPEPATNRLSRGDVTGYPYFPLDMARARALGGSSHLWDYEVAPGICRIRLRPLDPIDFERRAAIPFSGWPFGYETLAPYYRQAQPFFDLPDQPYTAEAWTAPTCRPLLSERSAVLRTALFQFGEPSRFYRVYGPALLTDPKITVCLHAHVLELLTNETGEAVVGVRVARPDRSELTVRARCVVLAAGGLENARLLLLSNRACPNGLGNAYDCVGRFFMEHLHFLSGLFVPADRALIPQLGFYRLHIRRNTWIMGKLALQEEVIRREGLGNYCVALWPTDRLALPRRNNPLLWGGFEALRVLREAVQHRTWPEDLPRQLLRLVRDLPRLVPWATTRLLALGGKRGSETRRPVAFVLHHMAEQLPNPESRVRLSRRRDAFGQPRLELHWQISRQDVESLLRAQQLIAQELVRQGWGTVQMETLRRIPPDGITGGFHHMGTTRMHASPREGVVDPNGRVHGVKNLYVAGSSVFPTVGFANPTLTIVALSLRLADHLKTRLT